MPTSALLRPYDDAAVRSADTPRVHLVGIAGAGMRSLADVLHAAGWSVSGSDLRAATLHPTHYHVADHHRADALDASVHLVVHSDAVPGDNPELTRARDLGVPVLSYPQMLGHLSEARRCAAVAGTHGKSTTTAMAGEILTVAGRDPTVIYGATPSEHRGKSRLGSGRWLLAEACEYRRNFRHLHPRVAVVLGIEHDHVDCFASLDEVEAAFTDFVHRVPSEGLVLARDDCAATRRAAVGPRCPVETFGLGADATWQATALRERRGCYSFQLRFRRRLVCDVMLTVPGRHNVLNALAAAALASHCGATGPAIRAGLARFAGLRRRLEVVADNGSIAVVDDYAHHPTAIAAALASVRQIYPGRRMWCIFEPHQISRTLRLLDGMAAALHNADKIIVTDVFTAREEPQGAGAAASDLVERIGRLGGQAVHRAGAADILNDLHTQLGPGDVVVTLGAGDIGAIAHELGQRFRTIRQAG